MSRSQGTGANRAGKRLENYVADILDEHRYKLVSPARFFPMRYLKQPIYARQLETGTSIYGKPRIVDAVLYHPRLWPNCLVIQSKWQSSGGSVDEKYPFEVLSIAQGEFDTIIVLDGGGYTPGARQWLINQAGKNRLLHVFDQGGFARFASQGRI